MTQSTHPNTKVFAGLIDSYMTCSEDRAEIQQPIMTTIQPQRAIARSDCWQPLRGTQASDFLQ